jgi:hypothetical protein
MTYGDAGNEGRPATAAGRPPLQPQENTAHPHADAPHWPQGWPQTERLPPDLARVVAAWPGLPAHIKAAILALVASAGG